ncbi:MAG: hypothetical protein AB1772_07205 [Candidatus Zixiibacteriota bacterium]
MRDVVIRVFVVWAVLAQLAEAGDLQQPTLIEVGPGRFCKWSPDGKYLSFANAKGLQLYVVDSGTVRTIAPPTEIDGLNEATYQWSSPDELLFTRNRKVKAEKGSYSQWDYLSIRSDGKVDVIYSESMNWGSQVRTRPRRLNTGGVVLARESVDSPEPLKKHRERAGLRSDAYYVVDGAFTGYLGVEINRGLWLLHPDGSKYKSISCEWDCRLPLLSPNGQYVMCRIGRVIIDTSGVVVGLFDHGIDFEDWFADSKRVLYTKPLQSEFDVIGNEIFMSELNATKEVQITSTPDKTEMDPVISPDMRRIAYRNYAADGHFIEILDFGEVIK